MGSLLFFSHFLSMSPTPQKTTLSSWLLLKEYKTYCQYFLFSDPEEREAVPMLQSRFNRIHEVCGNCFFNGYSVYYMYCNERYGFRSLIFFFLFQLMHKVEVFYVLCLFLTGKHKVMVSWQNHHDNISFLLVYQIWMDEKLWMKVNMFE